jgi:CubicO group peptidase (beta-lactamase class C family)
VRVDVPLKVFFSISLFITLSGLQSCAGHIAYTTKVNSRLKEKDQSKQFLIASNTKMFVGASILKLEEEGILTTSESVIRWIPELNDSKHSENWNKVSLDDLAYHVAHLPNFYSSDIFKNKAYKEIVEFKDVLEYLVKIEYTTIPDRKFSYCNTCYIVLGEVIRRASKMSFNNFLKDRFFKKLNMNQSEVNPASSIFSRSKHLENHVNETFTDGNLISSPADLSKWFDAILSNKVFKKVKTYEKFYRSFENDYGYGIFTYFKDKKHFISHGGSWLNFYSRFKVNTTSGDYYFFVTDTLSKEELQKHVKKFNTNIFLKEQK